MTVGELSAHLKGHWEEIREQLLAGTYQPRMVKRQLIPKGGGGMRELGIPTVLDRFIQQALLQVSQSDLDGSFSRHSYGFRPGRSAHEAVCAAQRYVQQGRRWWKNSANVIHLALPIRYFDQLGIPQLAATRSTF